MLYNEVTNDEKIKLEKLQNWFKVQLEVEATQILIDEKTLCATIIAKLLE